MKNKSEVSQIFQNFNAMIQTQFNTKIQVLKIDNAKEYFKDSLSLYLLHYGILYISSGVDTPQQNEVAKCKNRHLLEVAHCLLFLSYVPNFFWGEVVLTVAYLINRMPSRVLGFHCPTKVLLNFFHTPRLFQQIYHKKYLVAQHMSMFTLNTGPKLIPDLSSVYFSLFST